jgi:hypothetical protein
LGGTKARAAFREARGALIAALRQIAACIHSLGLTKESDVLSSGFDLAVWDTRQKPLTTPVLVWLDNSVFSNQLTLKMRAVANAKVYEVQFSADGAQTWQRLGIYQHTKGPAVRDICNACSCRWRLDTLQRLEQRHFRHGPLGGTQPNPQAIARTSLNARNA